MAKIIQNTGDPPEAATIELEVMVLGVFLDSIQSSSCSFLVIGLLLFRISAIGHDARSGNCSQGVRGQSLDVRNPAIWAHEVGIVPRCLKFTLFAGQREKT